MCNSIAINVVYFVFKYYILVHLDVSKDESVTLPKSATKELRSINVMNIDIYETCIRKLEPKQMINDNIISMLLK
jgi:hypothetical protein